MKIAIASCVSTLIAIFLNLENPSTCGVITLLSVLDTKKETLKIAGKRLIAFLISLVLAFFVYSFVGYTTIGFSVFLLLFIPICQGLHLEDGISICAVLITHFLPHQNMEQYILFNECALFLIGVFMGALINFYMPKSKKSDPIINELSAIDKLLKLIFFKISGILESNSEKDFLKKHLELLDKHIVVAEKLAYTNFNNNIIKDSRYYIHFLEMRRQQLYTLKKMQDTISLIGFLPPQANILAEIFQTIGNTLSEYNNATKILKQTDEIKQTMRLQPLPETRIEFESRALLFTLLYQTEEFLLLKYNFVENLSQYEKQHFWKTDDL